MPDKLEDFKKLFEAGYRPLQITNYGSANPNVKPGTNYLMAKGEDKKEITLNRNDAQLAKLLLDLYT